MPVAARERATLAKRASRGDRRQRSTRFRARGLLVPPGTCGTLKPDGRDVAEILVGEGLAKPLVCGHDHLRDVSHGGAGTAARARNCSSSGRMRKPKSD